MAFSSLQIQPEMQLLTIPVVLWSLPLNMASLDQRIPFSSQMVVLQGTALQTHVLVCVKKVRTQMKAAEMLASPELFPRSE